MPYSYKFVRVEIAYGIFHMEATPLQGQSPLPPNSPSLPAPSDGIQNLPSRRRAITDIPHTGTEYTFCIRPGRPTSGTATTSPRIQSLRITSTFPRIIRHKPPLIHTATAIMTTTRDEKAEDNRREGEGLPG